MNGRPSALSPFFEAFLWIQKTLLEIIVVAKVLLEYMLSIP